MKNIALIASAGSGKRMGGNEKKQYLCINDKPILYYTLKKIQDEALIDDIFLLVPKEDIEFCRLNIIEKYDLSKVKKVIAGGVLRQDSILNGLNEIEGYYDCVIIHDAVRPFFDASKLKDLIYACKEKGAAICGVPVNDTIKSVKDKAVVETLSRDKIFWIQTPQCFRFDILKECFRKAYDEKFYGTDDASLVERYGYEVFVLMGSYLNIKITTKEDLIIAKCLVDSGI